MRGPKHVVKRSKTSVLTENDNRRLLDSIDTSTVVGLCDDAGAGDVEPQHLEAHRVGALHAVRRDDGETTHPQTPARLER